MLLLAPFCLHIIICWVAQAKYCSSCSCYHNTRHNHTMRKRGDNTAGQHTNMQPVTMGLCLVETVFLLPCTEAPLSSLSPLLNSWTALAREGICTHMISSHTDKQNTLVLPFFLERQKQWSSEYQQDPEFMPI